MPPPPSYTVRRRELLVALAALPAGCLGGNGRASPDPTEDFGTKLSRGSAETVEAGSTADRSFESDGETVIVREDGDERRLDEDDWENEVCRRRGLSELRKALETSMRADEYAYVVPAFGEVGVEPARGEDVDRETLDSLGIQGSKALTVQYVVLINEDGDTVRSPAIGYRDVVEATPESVTVRSAFEDGTERSVDCPVVVWKTAGFR